MRVLITTQVYPPEVHPTAIMVSQLAEYLVDQGHEVAIAAGYPNHPGGLLHAGVRKRLVSRSGAGDVRISRLWHLTSSNPSYPVRAIAMVSQAVSTAVAGMLGGRADVVVNFGPPLLGPLLGAGVARLCGARLVSVVYDLYPDVAIHAGAVRSQVLIAGLRTVERASYGVAAQIVVLAEGFRRTLVARGVPESKITVIPVWLDSTEVTPKLRDNDWRSEQGIMLDKFVVLYSGTMGTVSGGLVLADVAQLLWTEESVQLLVVGAGRVKEELEAVVRHRGLTNITFLPPQPRSRLSDVQAAADVSIVTLAPGRGIASVPSKLVGYMAAGRPVIASVDAASDTGRAVRQARMGLVVAPGDARAISDAILRLFHDPPARRAMGLAARRAFEHAHSGERALASYREVIEKQVSDCALPLGHAMASPPLRRTWSLG